jgi:hypothetical protein
MVVLTTAWGQVLQDNMRGLIDVIVQDLTPVSSWVFYSASPVGADLTTTRWALCRPETPLRHP